MASTRGRHRHGDASADPGPPRNVAIFIDGTWNEAGTHASTNVWKLFKATPDGIQNGREQRRLYVSGVGTRPTTDAGVLSDAGYKAELARYLWRDLPPLASAEDRKLIGGVTGMGTIGRIKATYHFLCKNFRPQGRDQVFLFGFSRGAFAARSLAGFVGQVGLLLANKLEHVERAYAMYERSADPSQTELGDFLYELTGRRGVVNDDEFYLPMHFLGVWDTVASLGLPFRRRQFDAPFTEYRQVECPPSVMTARHALALHELRRPFEPLLWNPGLHRDLKQVWFAGAHADVGGGYKVGEDGLSDIALRWMAAEAMKCGLTVNSTAAWWTKWSERMSIHHECRNWFIACRPTPRAWLENPAGVTWQSHHFHRHAVDHLRAADRTVYAFRVPGVNSALRRVDTAALPVAVCLLLRGQETIDD